MIADSRQSITDKCHGGWLWSTMAPGGADSCIMARTSLIEIAMCRLRKRVRILWAYQGG